MRLNPLETKLGRLSTFFFLYMTEGLPHGFATVAVATEMRAQGVRPAVVNGFVAIILLPWAWKWAIGPFVDVFYSDRLGRRRVWIVMAQVMMMITLLAGMPVNFSTHVTLFTVILLIHNIFAATQDVAIDALACNVLKEEERGLANGLMFGGAHLGNIIGGAGVLYLTKYFVFNATFFFVAACILVITTLVSLRLKESPAKETRPAARGSRAAIASGEIKNYVLDALRAMFGSRAAFAGMIFALLPAGAYALSLPLQTNLGIELGLDREEVAKLMFVTGMVWVASCMVGGVLSDYFGRKRMLALYCLGAAIPTIYLAVAMSRYGWIMPVDLKAADVPIAPQGLVTALWTAASAYAVFNGLMYGARTALFMDITTPAVAATQFTAYMSLLNLTMSYSAAWQGFAVEKWGYPTTLTIDAGVGLLCILLLPWMTRPAGALGSGRE